MADVTDNDKAILAALLREAIERDRFPISPRVRAFKAILAQPAGTAPRAATATEAARRAQHVADKEAAQINLPGRVCRVALSAAGP